MWVSVDYSIQGKSHQRTNTPCQDKTVCTTFNGVYVAALADGAGSCIFSHFGAEVTTLAISELLQSNFDEYFRNSNSLQVKKQLIEKINEKLQKTAEKLKSTIDELSSTLLFVAIKDSRFILGHIGDGVIGYIKNAEIKVASAPDNGEFVNTTIFTTSRDVIKKMKIIKGEVSSIDGFILMSDGPEAVFYNKRNKYLARGLKKLTLLSQLIPQDNFRKILDITFNNQILKFTQDDCSLIFLTNCDHFKGFSCYSYFEKCSFLNLSLKQSKRINKRYFNIIEFLDKQSLDLNELSKMVYLKPKYLTKYTNKLLSYGLISMQDNIYRNATRLI